MAPMASGALVLGGGISSKVQPSSSGSRVDRGGDAEGRDFLGRLPDRFSAQFCLHKGLCRLQHAWLISTRWQECVCAPLLAGDRDPVIAVSRCCAAKECAGGVTAVINECLMRYVEALMRRSDEVRVMLGQLKRTHCHVSETQQHKHPGMMPVHMPQYPFSGNSRFLASTRDE